MDSKNTLSILLAHHALRSEEKMRRTMQLIKRLGHDEDGAALVEYTVLLGIMLVAVITTIGLVGGWMSTKWTALWSALSTN
jgi:pilus assembly protein Flp/PilA